MLASLLWMQSYGAYVVFLQQEFGWSKTVVAGAFALTRIESGILGPLQGWLVDRYGPRIILQIGVVLFGLGFIGFSRVETLLEFYLCFAVIALGSSLGGFATVMVSIVSWFNRHRAKAVAFSQIGYALGGMCVPLVVLALEAFGWRATAFYSGFLVILLGLPMAQAVRHRPETSGDVPDGRVLPALNPNAQIRADMTAGQAMKTPAFWLISLGHASALLTVSAVMVHLVPHLTEGLNFSLGRAALMVTLVTACQLVGQLLGGVLGDRFDKRWICVLCMVAHTGGLLLLAYATSQVDVVLFAVLHGLAWGIRGPLMVALRADYFGAASFGTIMGFSSLIVMLGMSFGPLVAGLFADYYGNYQLGLTVLALTAFLGCFCFLGARRPE
ncbi:MAG: MFS transporter [Pseudomonadales bacterium]|nr:MFS transporter [Pseudomonadales bacterium]